jgi:dTDP-4-dehydrorhamnose reductase
MKILITGAQGQIAWDLIQAAGKQDLDYIALTKAQLDITNQAHIEQAIRAYQPTCLVNLAAYTAVDQAEKEPKLAFRVNRDGPKLLAESCKRHCLPLIHLSTDYVFSGEKDAPYLETDIPEPLNVYGQSKYQGEILIRETLPQHIILRVSGVFGSQGHNFVKAIIRSAREKTELRVVSDQITCPTPACDIANVILQIIQQSFDQSSLYGIYHYCAFPSTSWYDFAVAVIEEAQLYQDLAVEKVFAIRTENYLTAALRAKYSVLDCQKIGQTFNISSVSWKLGLKQVVKALLI